MKRQSKDFDGSEGTGTKHEVTDAFQEIRNILGLVHPFMILPNKNKTIQNQNTYTCSLPKHAEYASYKGGKQGTHMYIFNKEMIPR
jgi:hypothetical protein